MYVYVSLQYPEINEVYQQHFHGELYHSIPGVKNAIQC